MITRLWTGTRRPGSSRQAFQEHWYGTHAPFGLALPGLRAYVQNHVVDLPESLANPVFDGCSELDFDDVAAMQTAFSSADIEAADRDERRFADPDRFGVVVTRRQPIFGASEPDTPARLLCFVRANPRRSRQELVRAALDRGVSEHARKAGAVRADLLVALDHVPEPQACDVVISLWFEDLTAGAAALPGWLAASSEALAGWVFGREVALVEPRRLR